MQKFFKRFIKRIQRLIENVKKGSVVDIALLITGAALVLTIVTIVVVMIVNGISGESQDASNLQSGASGQYNSADRNQSIAQGQSQSTVNPFGGTSQGSSSSTATQGASQSTASSSTTTTAANTSSSSTAATTTPTPAPDPTPEPETPHEHTYPAEWTRLAHVCQPGLEERRCTSCSETTEGHIQTRSVLAIAEHDWGEQTPVYDEDGSTVVGFSQTCSVCKSIWTEYYETAQSTPESGT